MTRDLPASGLTPETRETSEAAAAVAVESCDTLRERVFAAIRSAGDDGLTDSEIQEALQMGGNTERPRRVELWMAGRIEQHGERRNRSGRRCVVWVVAPPPSTDGRLF